MKKEASVILAKCAQDKLYGIRIEKRDNDWVRTWAFKLKEETAEKEGFDKINFTGSFYTDEEYPGCPYCGAKKCFVCGNCGKVSCYDGSDKVVCKVRRYPIFVTLSLRVEYSPKGSHSILALKK